MNLENLEMFHLLKIILSVNEFNLRLIIYLWMNVSGGENGYPPSDYWSVDATIDGHENVLALSLGTGHDIEQFKMPRPCSIS